MPILPPAYTTPAPVKQSGDARTMSAATVPALDAGAFPNVARWMRSVQSFTTEEVAQWK